MTEESWKLEKDLCRCCLSEGTFKNLAEPYKVEGKEEIYSEMLLDTLDIDLTPVAGPLCGHTYTICEECILRLRDACSFRNQVQLSEKRFRDLYGRDVIRLNSKLNSGLSVKLEVPDSGNEDEKVDVKLEMGMDEDGDLGMDFGCNDDDDHKSDVEQGLLDSKKTKSKKSKAKDAPKGKKTSARGRKPKAEAGASVAAESGGEGPKKKGGTAGKFRIAEADYTRDGDIYQCSRCERRYEKMLSLRSHVKAKHYNLLRFPCPYCELTFMTLAPLTVHKLEAHGVDDRFKCNACKGTFNSKVQLRKHINNFHMMGVRYKCDFCEYESFSFEGVDGKETESYYTVVEHEGKSQYECNICQRHYMRMDSVTQHYRHVHLKLRPKLRSCYLCEMKVPQHRRAKHMEEVHGVPRPQCNACGQKFGFPYQVISHQKRFHMNEKPFPCTKCDKRFSSRTLLETHIVKHSTVRQHKCQYCEKAFKWKKNLTAHIMMHLNDRRHVCKVCGEAFVQHTSLKYHVTKKHPDVN